MMKNKVVAFFALATVFFAESLFSQNNEVSKKNSTLESAFGYSTEVPELLRGIWQGSDRLLLFSDENSEFACVLRVFYQWYDDRAAEPSQYAQLSSRQKNDTTAVESQHIEISYRTIAENEDKSAGAYELCVKYPNQKQNVYIPIAIIENRIFLKFFIRQNNLNFKTDSEQDSYKNSSDYYLCDIGTSSGITISNPIQRKELLSYYVTNGAVYHIRYWLSDMVFTDEKAEFSDGSSVFYVNKFIKTAGRLYTCTTGRSLKIRNINKTNSLPLSFVSDSKFLIYTDSPAYLIKVPELKNRSDMQKIVDKNNQRRHPPLKPLFPAPEINFHWKEISELEKYNPYTWNRRNIDIH